MIETLELGENLIDNHIIPDCIKRYTTDKLPIHLAVHEINANDNFDVYCDVHEHEGEDELNIILGDVEFELLVGSDYQRVNSRTAVWIPAGVPHSANVTRGTGYFICIRFKKI